MRFKVFKGLKIGIRFQNLARFDLYADVYMSPCVSGKCQNNLTAAADQVNNEAKSRRFLRASRALTSSESVHIFKILKKLHYDF